MPCACIEGSREGNGEAVRREVGQQHRVWESAQTGLCPDFDSQARSSHAKSLDTSWGSCAGRAHHCQGTACLGWMGSAVPARSVFLWVQSSSSEEEKKVPRLSQVGEAAADGLACGQRPARALWGFPYLAQVTLNWRHTEVEWRK